MAVCRARFSTCAVPITPLLKVIPSDLFQFEFCNLVVVDIQPESPQRIFCGIRATLPAQVLQIGFEARAHCGALRGANRGRAQRREPLLRQSLRTIVVIRGGTIDRLVMPSCQAVTVFRDPRLRATAKAQMSALDQTMPVGLTPHRQTVSLSFSGQVWHGSNSVRHGTAILCLLGVNSEDQRPTNSLFSKAPLDRRAEIISLLRPVHGF